MRLLYLLGLVALVFSATVMAEDVPADVEAAVAGEEEEEEDEGFKGHGVFTDEELATLAETEDSHEFQAEVTRLMDIIINALYSNREVFLRELLSNSADALDKIRFQALEDTNALGDQEELKIEISFDKEKKTVTIRDTGVGMTKEELIKNLGTVAKSGTTEFAEAVAAGGSDALSLIGQFGVGFYSVYLVGDRVTVRSKSNSSPDQYVWQSDADRSFKVGKDPRGNTLGRGTEVTIHLKEDAEEFMSETEIKKIVHKYSQFLNFPIYLQVTKTVTEEVPVEPNEVDTDDSHVDGDVEVEMDGDDQLEVGDDEEEDDAPKTKTVSKQVTEFERVNEVKPIWMRDSKDLSDEDYNQFYKDFSKDSSDPHAKVHFAAEGEITFRSLMFVPPKAASDLYDSYHTKSNTNLKLYVRRVLISDELDNFLPRYLNFVKGVVDSDDLPLTVSRETLSQSRVMKVMAKKLTRKVLEMLKKMAEEEEAANEEEEEDDEEDEEEEEADTEDQATEGEEGEEDEEEEEVNTRYSDFYAQYGKSIKLGILEDKGNKNKLSKLLRFRTNKSPDKPISLDRYVENMDDNQRHIYYISGPSIEQVQASPFLERVTDLGYEVIFLIDSLDEYVTQHLTEYEGNQLMSITKDGLKLGGEEKKVELYEKDFEELTTFLKELYAERVEKVQVSPRLTSSPAIIVTSQYGWSANMERIMTAQAFADAGSNKHMTAKKTFEINPRHSIIREMKTRLEADAEDPEVKDLAELLYDAATIQSGFGLHDITKFAARVHSVMAKSLQVDVSDLAEEAVAPEEEESEEEEEKPQTVDDLMEDLNI
jgi:heat shock protein beta